MGSEAGNGAWDEGEHVEKFPIVLRRTAAQGGSRDKSPKGNFWCTCKLHDFPQQNTQLPHWILYIHCAVYKNWQHMYQTPNLTSMSSNCLTSSHMTRLVIGICSMKFESKDNRFRYIISFRVFAHAFKNKYQMKLHNSFKQIKTKARRQTRHG